ncbi:ABC transporter permease subunit [Mycoplasmopsis hyopharyngis]|uniref:ABC transporter permease subunit n=1 Tax=Mycoplasmopsis hyopharyngis TaxID=29558 RepID=UPI00387382B3
MNFYYFLFKKISLALLGVFITLIFSFVFLGIFINPFPEKPIVVQLFEYLGSLFTFKYGKIISPSISHSFINPALFFFYYSKYSIIFYLSTFIFSLVLGTCIGIFWGYKIHTWSEVITNIFIFIFSAIPTFILAPLGIIFAESIDLPINFVEPGILGISFTIRSLIIPIIILSFSTTSIIAIITKKNLANILSQEYVLLAKTNGMNNLQIFKKVIFKNLMIEQLNYLVLIFITMVSYGLIIERIFQIPGQSLLLSNILRSHELYIMITFIFFTSLFLYFAQAILEIFYHMLKVDNKLNLNFSIKRRTHNLFKKETR